MMLTNFYRWHSTGLGGKNSQIQKSQFKVRFFRIFDTSDAYSLKPYTPNGLKLAGNVVSSCICTCAKSNLWHFTPS
jgi:hypothetical protein